VSFSVLKLQGQVFPKAIANGAVAHNAEVKILHHPMKAAASKKSNQSRSFHGLFAHLNFKFENSIFGLRLPVQFR